MGTSLSPLSAVNQSFSDFIADCLVEIDNQNDKAEAALRRATVHQLAELSLVKASFMEDSFSFSLVEDTGAYDVDVILNWPLDILEIYQLYGSQGDGRFPVFGPVGIGQLRLRDNDTSRYPWPEVWAWHNDQLHISPKPSATGTLNFDYRKDGRRDGESGAVITKDSTTETNGWFGRGVNALRCAVLAEYHSSYSKDYDLAGQYRGQLGSALSTIESEWYVRQRPSMQAPWNYGGMGEPPDGRF